MMHNFTSDVRPGSDLPRQRFRLGFPSQKNVVQNNPGSSKYEITTQKKKHRNMMVLSIPGIFSVNSHA